MRNSLFVSFWASILITTGCTSCSDGRSDATGLAELPLSPSACQFVEEGFGVTGQVPIVVEEVASGLTVPWGLAFLPEENGGGFLVTERPGRVRRFRDGTLLEKPVVEINVGESGEGGLLGIAADPDFDSNRRFYVYYTVGGGGPTINRVERFVLSEDGITATSDGVLLNNIPAGVFHDGGRLRFGPDDMLYVATGDARNPDLAQDRDSLAGKILRINPENGQPVDDNPFEGSPVYILGVRNVQGFDWLQPGALLITDHGPSGELGRSGGDELTLAGAGDNLGWPDIWRCESREGIRSPLLSWQQALPPGGAAVYTGNTISEWEGDLIIGSLGSRHLQRVMLDRSGDQLRVTGHEVYLRGQYGRLREVIMGPDRHLYVTTSNCDSRGDCGEKRDLILRIRR